MTTTPQAAAPRFAANLKAARKAVGLTQAQVGARMRADGFPWSQSAVNAAEHGQRRVHLDEADALSQIVCVPLDRMVSDAPARVAGIAKDNMRGPVVV